VRLSPLAGSGLGALAVDGLRVAGTPVTVDVDYTGQPTVTGLPATLTVTTTPHIPTQRLATETPAPR
jgi:hypothetical protein